MNDKALRAFVLPFLLFFTLSTVTAPARAVLPLVAAGVSMLTEGGLAANGLAALTVGTVAGIIYLGNGASGVGTEAGSFMDIPLGSSGRDRPLSTPPNYTPPANNNAQPTPPSSGAVLSGWSTGVGAGFYAYPDMSLESAIAINLANNSCCWSGYSTIVADGTDFLVTYIPKPGFSTYIQRFRPYSSCAAGYTFSGSTCLLSNAAAVMKPADGRCQILKSVSGFSVDPNDPECSGLAGNGVTVAPGSVTSNKPGTLSNGKVVLNADGSTTITYTQGNITNNTSTVTTINMIPAAGGTTAMITGTSVTTVPGTGNLAVPVVVAPVIEFPDDYNLEATQTAIKTNTDTMKDDLANVKDNLNADAYALPAAPIKTPAELVAEENKKITDELALSVQSYDNFKLLDWSTWVPTLPAASCSPIVGNVMGKSFTWNLCPKIAMLNELIGWLLAIFAGWSVVSLMFRSRAN